MDRMRSKRERKRQREKAHKRSSDKKVNANTRAPNQEAVLSDGSRCRLILRSQEVDGSVAQMDPQLIADYIGQRIRWFETELSTVELEDRLIPGNRLRRVLHELSAKEDLTSTGVLRYHILRLGPKT
jgi:hypothetical protein